MNHSRGPEKPLVSIGLPVYNGGRYLQQTLEAILSQDFGRFELIVSDNASTDETASLCQSIAAKDKRIQYHRLDVNVGMYENFNRVFALSQGEYFIWAGAHDVWDSNVISGCLKVFEENPSIILCSPQYRHVDEHGRLSGISRVDLDTRGMPPSERFKRMIQHPLFCFAVYSMMKSSHLRNTRLFQQAFFSDRILWCELSLEGEFFHAKEASITMRRMASRDAEEGIDQKAKVLRLVPAQRARSANTFMMVRFPFFQLAFWTFRALYRSRISTGQKIRLTFCVPRSWKSNVLREFTTRWVPWALRKKVKRLTEQFSHTCPGSSS